MSALFPVFHRRCFFFPSCGCQERVKGVRKRVSRRDGKKEIPSEVCGVGRVILRLAFPLSVTVRERRSEERRLCPATFSRGRRVPEHHWSWWEDGGRRTIHACYSEEAEPRWESRPNVSSCTSSSPIPPETPTASAPGESRRTELLASADGGGQRKREIPMIGR